jgi:hypothetical protein
MQRGGGHGGGARGSPSAQADDQSAPCGALDNSTDGRVDDTPQRQEKSRSSTGSTDNNTTSRGRGSSEFEQQLENEPTRDATKMEKSRTTRMGNDPDGILGGEPSRGVLRY